MEMKPYARAIWTEQVEGSVITKYETDFCNNLTWVDVSQRCTGLKFIQFLEIK